MFLIELVTYFIVPLMSPEVSIKTLFFALLCLFPLSSNNSTGEENFLLQSQLKKNNKISVILRPLFVHSFPYVFFAVPCACVMATEETRVNKTKRCVQTVSFSSKNIKKSIFLSVTLSVSFQSNNRISERKKHPESGSMRLISSGF